MSQPIDTAFVDVRPDVDNFSRDLKRQLDRAFAGMRRNVDKSLDDVTSSFRKASTRIGEQGHAAGAGYGENLASQVKDKMDGLFRDANGRLRDARGKFVAEGERAGDGYGAGVVRGAQRSLTGLRKVVGRAVGAATAALKGLGVVALSAGGLASIAALVGAAAAALAGLASAAAAVIPIIASLATALITAAGAAAAIPGAIAVVIAVVKVLKLGFVGLGDAMKAVAEGDVEAFNEALKKLAPNARTFVKQVAALKSAFDRLRLGVQERLFAHTATVLKALAASTLPTVTVGFNRLAEVMNRSVVTALTALNTKANQRTLAAFLASAATAAANLGGALRPVGQALLDLIGVGAQVTAELSGGVAAAIGDFAKKISDLAASGGLKQVITDGLAVLGQFAGLAADVLGIVKGIFSAAGTGEGKDGGIFGFFDRLNQLVNRPDIQQAISSVFGSLADVGVALTPVLVALLKALVPVAAAIGQIAVAFAPTLVTFATDLGAALASLAPGFIALGPAVGALGGLLAPVAAILVDLVTAVAPGLESFIVALGAGLAAVAPAAGPVGEALGAILQAVAPLLPVLGAGLATILTALAGSLQILSAELGPLIELWAEFAVAGYQLVLPLFQTLATTALPLAIQVGQLLAEAFAPLIPVMIEIVRVIVDQLLVFLPQFQQILADLIPVFAVVANEVGAALLDLLLRLAPVIPDLVASGLELTLAMVQLFAALSPLIPPIVSLIALWARMAGDSTGGLKVVIGLLHIVTSSVTAAAGVFSAILAPVARAQQSVGRFGEAAKTGIATAVNAIKQLPGQIVSVFANFGSLLYNAGRALLDGLIRGIKSAIGSVKETLSGVTSLIPDWKGPEDEDRRLLRPAGQALMEGLSAGIDLGANDLRRQLQDLTRGIGVTVAVPAAATGPAPAAAPALSEERLARAVARALNGMEWRFVDIDRAVSRSIGSRADLARRGG